MIDQPYQFDFYDGGGLDVAFLGLAQADRAGNLNVSKFGPKLAGAGGFINISQNAKKVVFVGTFVRRQAADCAVATASIADHARRPQSRKFVEKVEHVTFSGAVRGKARADACSTSPSAACSRLTTDGLELTEIAPGIDLERDILAHDGFQAADPREPPS